MTARSSLEKTLEFLLNEEQEEANLAFHEFIIKTAQKIHESLVAEDDLDNDIDETTDEYFSKDELTTEDDESSEDEAVDDLEDDDLGDEEGEEENPEDEEDLGDEMENDVDSGEEVTLDADDVEELHDSLKALQAKFDALLGGEEEYEDKEDVSDEDDMDMVDNMDMGDETENMDDEDELEETGPNDPMNVNRKHRNTSPNGQYTGDNDSYNVYSESHDDDIDDEDELEEAITHDPGVQSGFLTDPEGKHGNKDSIKHNSDAKLPESAAFDFDLTEEDFLDLEESLKVIDVKMGGEQGGVKFAGEESNVKSPVAQKDKSDVKASPSSLLSKRDDHVGYDLEDYPLSGDLPHAGDNSRDSANDGRKEVEKGGGVEKQKGYGTGEVGKGKFAGTESNVKSPIGSAGSRNEK